MKKRILSAILAGVMTISLSGCGGKAEKTLTPEEKRNYVIGSEPQIDDNDLSCYLPFEGIIGMSLTELKKTVDTSDKWNEDVSKYSNFDKITGFTTTKDIAYTFSNRNDNKNLSSDASLLSHAVAGLINKKSTKNEKAIYVYVITDNSSMQIVTEVFVCHANTGATSSELVSAVLTDFTGGQTIENNGGITCTAYSGLISQVDYEEIYDYMYGLTTEYPSCLGYLYHYHTDDTLVLQISSAALYN